MSQIIALLRRTKFLELIIMLDFRCTHFVIISSSVQFVIACSVYNGRWNGR